MSLMAESGCYAGLKAVFLVKLRDTNHGSLIWINVANGPSQGL